MKKIVLFAAAALILTACDKNDDNITPSPVAARISATIGESSVTRASNNEWAAGDKIGISSTVGDAAGPYINMEYTTDKGDGTFTGADIFFYKPMTLTAYYPFNDSEGKAPGTDGVISADTRADNQTAETQPGIDFLWDSRTNKEDKDFTPEAGEVKFTFAHKMSKLTLKFKNGTGMDVVSKITKYEIEGLVLKGTFDTKTGICAVKTDAPAESLAIDVENIKDNESVLTLILFPQSPGSDKVKLHIYTDEEQNPDKENNTGLLQHYTCNLSFDEGKLEAGNNYQYEITVSKKELSVNQSGITPWVESELKNHTAVSED